MLRVITPFSGTCAPIAPIILLLSIQLTYYHFKLEKNKRGGNSVSYVANIFANEIFAIFLNYEIKALAEGSTFYTTRLATKQKTIGMWLSSRCD